MKATQAVFIDSVAHGLEGTLGGPASHQETLATEGHCLDDDEDFNRQSYAKVVASSMPATTQIVQRSCLPSSLRRRLSYPGRLLFGGPDVHYLPKCVGACHIVHMQEESKFRAVVYLPLFLALARVRKLHFPMPLLCHNLNLRECAAPCAPD